MENTPKSGCQRFLDRAIQMGSARPRDADYRLYELLKADLARECPGISHEQYQAAISAISRATGV